MRDESDMSNFAPAPSPGHDQWLTLGAQPLQRLPRLPRCELGRRRPHEHRFELRPRPPEMRSDTADVVPGIGRTSRSTF